MRRLDEKAYAGVGRFIAAAPASSDEPFPVAFLDALQGLVPCDDVAFSELDRVRQIELGYLSNADDAFEPDVSYWDIRDEHPACLQHEMTGDFRAHRVTDFVTRRQLRRSRLYAEWFRPGGVEHQVTVGLDAPLSHTKVFLFSRAAGRDFTTQDCDVLDVLRPYLQGRYELWRTRRRLEPIPDVARLTSREREVLALVAHGLRNVEIAQRLWISPGTVRRHLENAYDKLGVHTRTAAVRALASHLE